MLLFSYYHRKVLYTYPRPEISIHPPTYSTEGATSVFAIFLEILKTGLLALLVALHFRPVGPSVDGLVGGQSFKTSLASRLASLFFLTLTGEMPLHLIYFALCLFCNILRFEKNVNFTRTQCIKVIITGENQWSSASTSQWRDATTPDIFCTSPIFQKFEI